MNDNTYMTDRQNADWCTDLECSYIDFTGTIDQ